MKNFSITVFFFHLNQTLSEPLDQVSNKADLIWENLIKLSEKLPFVELKDLKSKLVCYELDRESKVFRHKKEALNLINHWLTKDQRPIKLTTIDKNKLAISGMLQPFLLHDTYAFDLTLFPKNPDQDITAQDLSLFEPSSLFLEFSENTLGETIWLYGQPEVADTECQEVADRYVESFVKNTNFSARLIENGSLFKVPLFEYEISEKNQPNKLYRILVWMDNQAIYPAITPVYDYLFGTMGLYHKIEYVYEQGRKSYFASLGLYHKIEYAYKQGRESYSEAREVYSQLEAKIKEFKREQSLEELQKLLESMPELSMQYQRQLRNLKAHYTTIKANQINYKNYLQEFWQPGDIPALKEFGETTCKRYLEQIETDLNYIQPGKDLISEFINTLRGLVEIEQAKCDRDSAKADKERDRNLQIIIASVGVGIGVAGVTATAFPYYLKPADKPEKIKFPGNFYLPQNIKVPDNFYPHPITQSIFISLFIGFLASIVPWVLFSIWRRRPGKFSKKSKQLSSKQLPQQKQVTLSSSSSPEIPAPTQQTSKVAEPLPANSDKT